MNPRLKQTAKLFARHLLPTPVLKHLSFVLQKRRAHSLHWALEFLDRSPLKKLHLGGGDHALKGWLNTDIEIRPETLYLDICKTFPFDTATFDYVFNEHLIEHVPYVSGCHMISECFRVLKPKGKIRVATPSLQFLVDLWTVPRSALQQRYLEWATQLFIPNAPTVDPVFVINNFVRDWGHQFIYCEKTLSHVLTQAGFRDLKTMKVTLSEDPNLRGLENTSRMPEGFLDLETMVIEATKP